MVHVTSRAYFPPSLRALLTNNTVIKLGFDIQQQLSDIAVIFNDPDIHKVVKSNATMVNLGQYAKLKGAVSDPFSSLHVLAGSILKNFFSPPSTPVQETWGPT
jgi:hypothetical protein